jgi:ATP-dependent DNA helicase DinG
MGDSCDALKTGGEFHQQIEGFIPRIEQQEMARSVEESLNYSGRLVVESGTGTGKTYAYLVPVVLSGKRTIISTGTKHLQEQIFYRDLPVVLRMLNETLSAQMLKGRSNYLCRYRHKLNSQQSDLIGKENRFGYDVIDKWASRTDTGDVSEVSGVNEAAPIWKQVTSTADNCLGAKCPDYGNCFVNQARQRAMKADVVVVNHHLFFSDLTLKTEGFGELLPDHEAVIFDEAHTIPDTASKFFGFSISSFQLKDLVSDILVAEKEERSAVKFSTCISELERDLDRILAYCSQLKTPSELLVNLKTAKFDELLEQFLKGVDDLNTALVMAAPAGEGLAKCQNRCQQFLDGLDLWWEDRNRNAVCWFECTQYGFKIHTTPLNVGEHFSKIIESPGVAWIFTSATLAVGEDFSAFCNEIGLENAETKRWESPYDFRNNALLFLPPDLPDPREHNFSQVLTSTILDVTEASSGRTFCLFTSHAMMEKVYQLLKHTIKWPIHVQGQAPRQQLLDQFLQSDNSVLLGTSSFWEGVDVKGEALSCVIIDKLPFASPSDPVLKSKLKNSEEQGGNPFMDIQIPNAVISLKQGAGRLIRSESDRGVLVICDQRITEKSYGKLFLKSLPPIPVTTSIGDVFGFFR